MAYYLGVDIGTTSAKAVAFNDKGEILSKHSIGYEMKHPQKNFSEQDPEEIYQAVVLSINQTVEELLPQQPLLLSFSAMMHSLIAVDEQGKPLTDCWIWADNRAADIAVELRKSRKGSLIYQLTGVPIHAMTPMCKLLWMKANDPELFQSAHKFIGIKEFIFFKLFGKYVVDTAIASATGLLNIESLEWDGEVLEYLDLSPERLSVLCSVEQAFTTNSSPLQLDQNIPFVIGGSDGALANLGTGSIGNDSISVTIGTSSAVRILSEEPIRQASMSLFCYHANDKQYIIGGGSNNGAVVIQWLKDSLLQAPENFSEFFELAETVPAGCDDLIFVPYILGERAPVWNSDAKGVFFGLTINHTKAHLLRAAMEGVIYNLFSIGKPIMEIAPVGKIYAAGGFAQSTLWLQMLADVFNCTVLVSGSPESSALGAVIVALEGLKIPLEIKPVIISEHKPNADKHAIYQEHFQKFERLYQLLKDEFVFSPAASPVLSD